VYVLLMCVCVCVCVCDWLLNRMASWDSYIKNLMDDGIIEEAAICGMNPPSVWAKSPQMSISVKTHTHTHTHTHTNSEWGKNTQKSA